MNSVKLMKTINPLEILNIMPILEGEFINDITKNIYRNGLNPSKYNFCCDNNVREFIVKTTIELAKITPYNELSISEICRVLIFISYSLAYSDHNEDLVISNYFLKRCRGTKHRSWNWNPTPREVSLKLFQDITMKDVMLNGKNISSHIRNFFIHGNDYKCFYTDLYPKNMYFEFKRI